LRTTTCRSEAGSAFVAGPGARSTRMIVAPAPSSAPVTRSSDPDWAADADSPGERSDEMLIEPRRASPVTPRSQLRGSIQVVGSAEQ
jgi:hypothetical protein